MKVGVVKVWRHIAHSVQGHAHIADGTPCQDSHCVRVLGGDPAAGTGDVLIACVADGAGRSKHSDIGSAIACETVLESAVAYFESHGTFAELQHVEVRDWCEAARQKLSDDAAQRELDLREFATTLCAAIVSPAGSFFFQIGDGAIILKKKEICGVAFWPQSGEYVNTTNFLTSEGFQSHLQFCAAGNGFSDVALLTDGMERLALKFDSQIPHSPFFDPLFRALRSASSAGGLGEELRRFLQSDSVRNRTDDDKTLILASWIVDETKDVR